MKRALFLFLLTGCSAFSSQDWSRYEGIIARAPFGKEPSPAETAEPVRPAGEFTKQYRLCLLYKNAAGKFKAGVVNKTDNKSLLLQVGETEKGLSLVDVRLEEGIAVLRQNGETAQLVLEGLAAPALSSGAAVAAVLPVESGKTQPVLRIGSNTPPEHILAALADATPKQPRMTVRKTELQTAEAADLNDGGSAALSSGAEKKITIRAPSAYLVQSVPKRYSPF